MVTRLAGGVDRGGGHLGGPGGVVGDLPDRGAHLLVPVLPGEMAEHAPS